MSVYATDTHALLWYADRMYRQLSHRARRAFEQAENGEAFILIPAPVLVGSLNPRKALATDYVDLQSEGHGITKV
jgi:hypothetical protein